MKPIFLLLTIGSLCLGCGVREKERLESRIDSLNVVLQQSKQTETAMNEIGVVLDSIDMNREALHKNIVEGMPYADYIDRLKDINNHIKESKVKVAELEVRLRNSNSASAATVRRLKMDLETRSKEIVALQMDVVNLRDQNRNLFKNVSQKDSIISYRDEIIKLKNADVETLQGLVQDINDQDRMKVANLYFAQAQALEEAADRTKFAPRKKKETRREALELYKLASSLGNTEAQEKITNLEKKLS